MHDRLPCPSIVMPVLNEATGLGATLQTLASLTERGVQLIVSDGGSSDGTPALAEAAGSKVINAPRGRALQMNAGAQQAIFMTRAAFDAVGGFPAQPLMEDIEIWKRLRQITRPTCLRAKV